jgi:hypothetical protein
MKKAFRSGTYKIRGNVSLSPAKASFGKHPRSPKTQQVVTFESDKKGKSKFTLEHIKKRV